MGQRSQIYIRYNKGENIVAYHLQWNWGTYMINRAYQLLQFIEKNVSEERYSNFLSTNFSIKNYGSQRDDYEILSQLIQINNTVGSYVKGSDLVDEEYYYGNKIDNEKFKLSPEKQDNNDGILVIDIQEDEQGKATIKYGFVSGESLYSDNIRIITASEYMEHYKCDIDYMKQQAKTEEDQKEVLEIIAEIYKQQTYIDETFKKLTLDEYQSIFIKKYEYKKNLINYEKIKQEENLPSF